ncbi:MAG: hypothetical protein WAM14_26900 [Candidatus Nitrosopolaris sp.]
MSVRNACLEIEQIFDDEKGTSLKFNHIRKQQKQYETQSETDIKGIIHKKRQEL